MIKKTTPHIIEYLENRKICASKIRSEQKIRILKEDKTLILLTRVL